MVAFTRLEGLSFDGGAWRAAASSVDGMLVGQARDVLNVYASTLNTHDTRRGDHRSGTCRR
jgi:hypothetical protein